MLAAAVIVAMPVVLVRVLLQRRFIEGMTAGAVKAIDSSCFNLLFFQIPLGGPVSDIHRAAPVAASAEALRESSINRSTDCIAKLRND